MCQNIKVWLKSWKKHSAVRVKTEVGLSLRHKTYSSKICQLMLSKEEQESWRIPMSGYTNIAYRNIKFLGNGALDTSLKYIRSFSIALIFSLYTHTMGKIHIHFSDCISCFILMFMKSLLLSNRCHTFCVSYITPETRIVVIFVVLCIL